MASLPSGLTLVNPDDNQQSKLPPGLQLMQQNQGPQLPPGTIGGMLKEGAKNVGIGALKGLGHTALNLANLTPAGDVADTIGRPINTDPDILKPQGAAQKAGHFIEQVAEFLAPMGLEEKAAGLIPDAMKGARFLRPAARIGAQALDTGAVNALHGGSFKQGAEMGLGGGVLGEGARAIAPQIARFSLGVPTREMLHGATPGEAALNEISGVRPGTLARNAQSKIGELTSQLESKAAAAPAPVTPSFGSASVQPALDVIDDSIAKARSRNSPVLPDLIDLRRQLTHSLETGNPLPPVTNAGDLVNLRRGVNDRITNWTREAKGDQGTARGVYGALTGKVHELAPETEGLDQRISSLIPVTKHAAFQEQAPGIAGRILDRTARHTGALVSSGLGGLEGYREGGAKGAAIGAAAGLVVPELISSPTGQMIVARGLNSGIGTHALPAATLELLREEEKEQQK